MPLIWGIDTKGAAWVLGVSVSTIKRMVYRGELKPINLEGTSETKLEQAASLLSAVQAEMASRADRGSDDYVKSWKDLYWLRERLGFVLFRETPSRFSWRRSLRVSPSLEVAYPTIGTPGCAQDIFRVNGFLGAQAY
jgi:hypothetical protein